MKDIFSKFQVIVFFLIFAALVLQSCENKKTPINPSKNEIEVVDYEFFNTLGDQGTATYVIAGIDTMLHGIKYQSGNSLAVIIPSTDGIVDLKKQKTDTIFFIFNRNEKIGAFNFDTKNAKIIALDTVEKLSFQTFSSQEDYQIFLKKEERGLKKSIEDFLSLSDKKLETLEIY